MPTYFMRHAYLCDSNSGMQRTRQPGFLLIATSTASNGHHEMDCSGRSLATLFVAWVGAAMVASILLRWKYVWVALAVLTLLFLFVCGYTACTTCRTREALAREEARLAEQGRRQEREIETISGRTDANQTEGDPPMYQTYWVTDLPPPYASVIASQSANMLPHPPAMTVDGEGPASGSLQTRRLSNPPPYSMALEADQSRTAAASSESRNPDERDFVAIPLHHSESALSIGKEDKRTVEEETRVNPQGQCVTTVTAATRTNCLSNILQYTFGRNQRPRSDSESVPENVSNRNRINASQNLPDLQSSSDSVRTGVTSDYRLHAGSVTRCNSF